MLNRFNKYPPILLFLLELNKKIEVEQNVKLHQFHWKNSATIISLNQEAPVSSRKNGCVGVIALSSYILK